jgi:hypothetical protein
MSIADPSQKHMPDKAEKEMLAARINDTLKYVNIWFQVGILQSEVATPLTCRRTADKRHRRKASCDRARP